MIITLGLHGFTISGVPRMFFWCFLDQSLDVIVGLHGFTMSGVSWMFLGCPDVLDQCLYDTDNNVGSTWVHYFRGSPDVLLVFPGSKS